MHKKITEKVSKDLTIIQKELILIVQNLFLLHDSAKGKIAKNFLNSFYNGANILIYGNSINVIYSIIYSKKLGKTFVVCVASQSKNDYYWNF